MFGNWGFGDPNYEADGFYGSSGFGFAQVPSWDPDTDPCIYGFLHPDMGFLAPVIVLGEGRWPDNGGAVMRLTGPWTTLGAQAFRVKLRNQLNVSSPAAGCQSAEPGEGTAITVDPDVGQLLFCLPALPPGIYDVLVYDADTGSELLSYTAAVVIVRRGRNPMTWAMRNGLLPAFFRAGARSAIMETQLGGLRAPE